MSRRTHSVHDHDTDVTLSLVVDSTTGKDRIVEVTLAFEGGLTSEHLLMLEQAGLALPQVRRSKAAAPKRPRAVTSKVEPIEVTEQLPIEVDDTTARIPRSRKPDIAEFVAASKQCGGDAVCLAEHFGVKRNNIYDWRRHFRKHGLLAA